VVVETEGWLSSVDKVRNIVSQLSSELAEKCGVCRPFFIVVNCYSYYLELTPFKPSGVKWLHFKVFSAILV